jgi:O-antigen/teichoic acid export membrane protein
MARLLSVSDFGILAALFSIVYIMSVFSESIQTIIAKYTSKISQKGKLKNITKRATKRAFRLSIYFFVFFAVISLFLFRILDIKYFLLVLTGSMLIFIFTLPVTRGVLQGRKRFHSLGLSVFTEAFAKLVFSILFVLAGIGVYGAILGSLLGLVASFALSFVSLKDIFSSKETKAKTKEVYNYATPTFFIMLVVLIFYSIDVIIAKIVFLPEVAGAYSIASVIAKTIFFATLPISKAMFPLTSSGKNKKHNENIFLSSVLLLFALIFVAIIIFYSFSNLIITVFSGKTIHLASAILVYLGIAFSLISITNLVLLYNLSIGKTKGYKLLSIFVVLEAVLLFIF